MKKAAEAKTIARERSAENQIDAYSHAQPSAFRTICDLVRELIDDALPKATSKVWHGSPVWFMRWLTKAKADVFDSKAFFRFLPRGSRCETEFRGRAFPNGVWEREARRLAALQMPFSSWQPPYTPEQ
jgi:hypothetical protein